MPAAKVASLTGPAIPISGISGIGWPAIPQRGNAVLFALLQQLEESQWWPYETLLEQQLRQLERVLAYAARHVPFYAERLKVLRGVPRGGLTLEAFRQIPLLKRSDIQDAGDALVSRNIPADHKPVGEVRTSGSTGRPITVKGTAITQMMLRANNLRYHRWFKRDFTRKVAAIRLLKGAQLKAAAADKAMGWADAYPSGPMVLRHITTPLSEQLDWLLKEDPDYLLTFPSNLMALVQRSRELGVKPKKLSQAITLGEVLDPSVREACTAGWGVPVADAYSSEEFGMIAVQCPDHPEHHYHVQAESVLLEILDDTGLPCRPGQIGRMVVTSLNNYATPLIRYAIGDMIEAGAACSCGRGLPMIARILGRTRNMLHLPSGEQICPRFKFEDFTYRFRIRQFQVIQESVEQLTLRLVVDRALTAEQERGIAQMLVASATHPFRVRFEYVPEIPRAVSGKFEEFRSEVAA